MNWKTGSFIGFSVILLFYGLLYIATSKEHPCGDVCEQITLVEASLKKDRPFVYYVFQCRDSNLCVAVRDTIPYSWNLLADTACIYLKTQSLFNYKVNVIKMNLVDTIGKQQCL